MNSNPTANWLPYGLTREQIAALALSIAHKLAKYHKRWPESRFQGDDWPVLQETRIRHCADELMLSAF